MKDTKFDIKKRRDELGLTLEQVADKVGVGKSTVRKWETGDIKNMRRDNIAALADALHISPLELIDVEDRINEKPTRNIFLQYVGYGSCGNGALNEEAVEWRDVPEWVLGNKRNYDNYFLASAKGDSMERAGIMNGSTLIFYRQSDLNNGDIGVFNLNGEEYIKRYSRQGNIIILNSEALKDGYDPIIVTENDDFRIIAKLYKCIIDFE